MRRGSNQVRLADFNTAVVLDTIRRSPEGISRAVLGQRTGLTAQTISNIARRLLERDLIQEGDPVPGARGKPPTPLTIEPDGCFALGVHIDPARLTFVLLDLAGDVRGLTRLRTPKARFPSRVIDLIARTAESLVAKAGVDGTRVLGLGVAAPGPVDVTAGVMVDPPQLPQWRNVALRRDLHTALEIPVLMEKDVTAAAVAELRASPATSHDFAFCYLGSGVGAGLVLGDEVVRGAASNVGEIGEILVDPEADDLGWGRRGSLATACIPQALVERAARRSILEAPPHEDYGAVDDALTRLCRLADSGDRAAAELIDQSADALAVGLSVLVNLLDLDRVVLGGPTWSRLSGRYLEQIPQCLAERLTARAGPIPVIGSAVGEHVAAQGAAALVLDHFLAPRPAVLVMD